MRASASERARKFHIIFIYQCNFNAIANNVQTMNHEWYHKRKRRSSLRRIIIVLDKHERASNAAENAPFIPWGASFCYLFFSMRNVGTTNGTNLRVNALFRYEYAPSFRNLPTLCILHKTVPHYRGKIMIHWDNFPGSTIPIKALMWRAKCPINAWRCPFAHELCLLFTTVHRSEIHGDNFPVPSSQNKPQYEGLNAPSRA